MVSREKHSKSPTLQQTMGINRLEVSSKRKRLVKELSISRCGVVAILKDSSLTFDELSVRLSLT